MQSDARRKEGDGLGNSNYGFQENLQEEHCGFCALDPVARLRIQGDISLPFAQ
jgi:hypothetical protein